MRVLVVVICAVIMSTIVVGLSEIYPNDNENNNDNEE